MNAELPIREAGLGWAYGCSRRGPTHRLAGTPCQDAYGIATGAVAGLPYVAVAVADGHGDPRHDRSQYGADLAVRVALDDLRALYAHFGPGKPGGSLWRSFRADFPRRFVRRWREAVLEDAKNRPPDILGTDEGDRLWTRYGTTLLAALVVADAILVGQIGDGDLAFVRAEGSVESPIRRDASLVGTATHSLCSTDSPHLWQTAVIQRGAGGLPEVR
jgi:hypothetical protein